MNTEERKHWLENLKVGDLIKIERGTSMPGIFKISRETSARFYFHNAEGFETGCFNKQSGAVVGSRSSRTGTEYVSAYTLEDAHRVQRVKLIREIERTDWSRLTDNQLLSIRARIQHDVKFIEREREVDVQ